MAGIVNDVLYALNSDFTGGNSLLASESNGLVTDGKMWIGSTATNAGGTHINVGSITSPLGTMSIGYTSPNITIDVVSATNRIPGIYGDGSDGLLTWDGSATILGLVPAANVYTLNRDIYMDSSTINSGVSIISNGFKIFCNGTLTNNGTIQWNGNAGTALGVAGAEISNVSSSFWTGASGSNGGNGNLGAGSNSSVSPTTPLGGRGGNGGLGSSGAGGNGLALSAVDPSKGTFKSIVQASTLSLFLNNVSTYGACGGGGAGGGGGDGVNKGGGGGSGAGVVGVYAYFIAGIGTISAIGGAGGSTTLGNTGGGGGGGGGFIVIISRSAISGAVAGQTISVAGGAGGTKTGTGVNGVAGAIGSTIFLQD